MDIGPSREMSQLIDVLLECLVRVFLIHFAWCVNVVLPNPQVLDNRSLTGRKLPRTSLILFVGSQTEPFLTLSQLLNFFLCFRFVSISSSHGCSEVSISNALLFGPNQMDDVVGVPFVTKSCSGVLLRLDCLVA